MRKTQSGSQRGSALALINRAGLACALCLVGTTACAPEVGSERWCKKMKETPKIDWSTREASDYAKHCLFNR